MISYVQVENRYLSDRSQSDFTKLKTSLQFQQGEHLILSDEYLSKGNSAINLLAQRKMIVIISIRPYSSTSPTKKLPVTNEKFLFVLGVLLARNLTDTRALWDTESRAIHRILKLKSTEKARARLRFSPRFLRRERAEKTEGGEEV
ncbi:hypothetical protein SAY87_032162 [Trapa incisa]|uniref:Uncharacterized protein n=1 Tax=Trapa incisa TaxID=236973 RepID=A0AAN7KRG6_9MYRT|nr:hypothetical protein SAY87_032162 [Trapa incisa]